MSDERRVKNTGQSVSPLPETTLVPRVRPTALPQPLHSRQCVTSVVPRVIPSPVVGQRQINTFPKALVPHALNAPSHLESRLLYYRVDRYASQEECAQICLRR